MHQLHDRLFKFVMRIDSEARRFLRYFVNPDLVKELNLDSLVLAPETIIDEKLAQYFTDVTYTCQTKSKQQTRIFFLFEHKSYPDRNILLQILYYQASQYWKQISEDKQPELVIPIIFVHGKRKFKITPLAEVFRLQKTTLAGYLPTYKYELFNINQLPPNALIPIRATYLISMMLAFKGKGEKQQLLTNIREIFNFVQAHNNRELEKAFMYALVEYLVGIYKLKQEDMDQIQTQIPKLATPAFKEMGFNIWHEGREEGRIEEKKKGQIKEISTKLEFVVNLLCDAGMLSDVTKAKLANVDITFVKEVRKTFTRRAIKKRKEQFRLFYQDIEGIKEDDYQEVDQIFEQLRQKIKSAKVKITAKEKKKSSK